MSEEYVFVFDVSGARPVQRQVILVPNTFLGLAWAPSGERFYVSGGVDDCVYEYAQERGRVSRRPARSSSATRRASAWRSSRRPARWRSARTAAAAGRQRPERLGQR